MPESHGKALRCYMNWLALSGMTVPGEDYLVALRAAGYDGIQLVDSTPEGIAEEARALGLGVCGSGRVNAAEDADRIARAAREQGQQPTERKP